MSVCGTEWPKRGRERERERLGTLQRTGPREQKSLRREHTLGVLSKGRPLHGGGGGADTGPCGAREDERGPGLSESILSDSSATQ